MAERTDTRRRLRVTPPLNDREVGFLLGFAHRGPFDHDTGGFRPLPGVRRVWRGQPGAWSPWVPCADGCCLVLVEGRRDAHAAVWLRFLIREFLRPGAVTAGTEHEPAGFRFDHRVDGRVTVHGDGPVDLRVLVVTHNRVSERRPAVRPDNLAWPPPTASAPRPPRPRRGVVLQLDVTRRRVGAPAQSTER